MVGSCEGRRDLNLISCCPEKLPPMLHVTEADVKRILSLPLALELVREAYLKLAQGRATNPERIILPVPNGASMYFMPGYIHGQRTVAIKAARVNSDNSKVSLPTVLVTVYAFNSTTGVQVAQIEADWLTAVRTAASTAVATDLLARKKVQVLGVFGSGIEARSHILALRLVRDFETVLVYSTTAVKREAFAKQMSEETGLQVQAVESPDYVAAEADVVLTATTSSTPVFQGKLVKSGTLVDAIGRSAPDAREVDTDLVRRARVVVDSREQALATYGDVMSPVKENVLRESDILELGELLSKKSEIRPSDKDVTMFKAGGLAVLDAMVTDYILNSLSRETASS